MRDSDVDGIILGGQIRFGAHVTTRKSLTFRLEYKASLIAKTV